ncbi:MAG: glycosyltransferase family 2 protein [Pyrinomonadaceae bacterium]|nr:glycosyltransferase family 2 protein [Pyrinomonadaceae bacterium]
MVIPCYNEERFIRGALQQLVDQFDYERYEIIVVDGLSEDQTRTLIEQFRREHPELLVKLIDNPARNIPTALNLGITEARGGIIARMDAHAVPSSGYIRRCVEVLNETNAGVVGMPCRIRPGADTLIARAIAEAVSHPFGIGDAKYRLRKGESSQEAVDTVAFACFRKALWRELGGFNETLLTNEDYDFNYRVRLTGQKVILDRSGHCDYFARASLLGLAKQYFRYGGWKARMLRLHPGSIKCRHLVAPAFVASLVLLTIIGIFLSIPWWLLAFELGSYLLLSIIFGYQVARETGETRFMILIMPIVFFTIHVSWGASFFVGLIGNPGRKRDY